MKKVIFAFVAFVSSLLFLVVCKSTNETETPKHQVDIVNFAFNPESLDITAGDTVVWINKGSVSHTTTSGIDGVPDGHWDSGLMAPGDSFTHVFQTAGTFPYFCAIHFSTAGMKGRIIVR
jgi:manganese oxidase